MLKHPKAFLMTGLLWALDASSKAWALKTLVTGFAWKITPFLNFYIAFNPGIAFSLFNSGSRWMSTAILSSTGLITALLIFVLALKKLRPWHQLSLALVLAGALGNLCDRVVYGHVIDFIDLHYASWHFPTFNIADICITLGTLMLLLFPMK